MHEPLPALEPQQQQLHSVQKNHTATISKLNISGRESIFIPVSVGTNSYQPEPFLALAKGLIKSFKEYPNTPVYILIGDSVQAETILFRRTEQFKYSLEDFMEKNKEALDAKVKAYHVEALEIAKAEGKKWEEDCKEGIELLRKHFNKVNVEHWEDKKSKIKGETKVATADDNGEKKETIFKGYDAKVAEFNQHNVKGTLFHSLVNAAGAHYYASFSSAECDGLNVLANNKPLTDENFIRARSLAYLTQDVIVLSEAISDLQETPERPNVCLAYPYPHGLPTQSATLRAIQCNLALCDEKRAIAPRLETPEIRINPSNAGKHDKQKNSVDSGNKKSEARPRAGSAEKPSASDAGNNGSVSGQAATQLSSTVVGPSMRAPNSHQPFLAPSIPPHNSDNSGLDPESSSVRTPSATTGESSVVSVVPPDNTSKTIGLPHTSPPTTTLEMPTNTVVSIQKPTAKTIQQAPSAAAPKAALFHGAGPAAKPDVKQAQAEIYRKAGEKLSALRGFDPDAEDDALLFFQYKAFKSGMHATHGTQPISIPPAASPVIHAGTPRNSSSP